MAELVVFHHVQGLTHGVRSIADVFRDQGHTVTVPDLFEGRTFEAIADGMAFVDEIGSDVVLERALSVVESLGSALVYVGFSLGARPAQMLAQTRSGSRGALLFHGFYPSDLFADEWPAGVPLQVHVMGDDEWCDPELASKLDRDLPESEVFVYPGSGHLFTDESVADFEPVAAALAVERALEFLNRLGSP